MHLSFMGLETSLMYNFQLAPVNHVSSRFSRSLLSEFKSSFIPFGVCFAFGDQLKSLHGFLLDFISFAPHLHPALLYQETEKPN